MNVGKSCLINRYTENAFYSSNLGTIGIDFRIKYIEILGKKVKICLYDTSGQYKFVNLAKNYYRKVDGIILSYDCTEK